MTAVYRHEDCRRGRDQMAKLITAISTGVPNALTEIITRGGR